jgi:C4-dicarboxylate-specific signal transduction histidine kinase
MRVTGLKSHIIITLAFLLVAAMLLADLVITMFWQQSLLRSEVQKITTILALEAQHLTTLHSRQQSTDFAATAQSVRDHLGAECLIILDNDGAIFTSESSCPHPDEVGKAIRDCSASRSPVAAPLGSSWGLFTARPAFLLVAVPLQAPLTTGGIGALTSLNPVYAQVRQKQKTIFVYLLVNILLLSTIGFYRLAKSTVRPIERLVQRTEAYDDTSEFLLVADQEVNEFGQLSSALNRMTRRIDDDRKRLRETVASLESANIRLQQAQQDMIRAEKLAAVGRLSAGLAHEIGNPIGIIQGYLELLQRDGLSREDRLQYSQRAISELNRINRLIRQLLDFARTSPPGTQPVAMNELIRTLVDMFKSRKNMDRIAFRLHLDAENDLVEANEESIRQVLLNCLLNSVDAIIDKGDAFPGEITVSTQGLDAEDRPGQLAVAIRDNGCGIDPDHLNNIFDPFFTTKEPGKGTGLGLAVSLAIVEAAGGQIEVRSEVGTGTEIRIILPRTIQIT